jgi:hypothetical protein
MSIAGRSVATTEKRNRLGRPVALAYDRLGGLKGAARSRSRERSARSKTAGSERWNREQ